MQIFPDCLLSNNKQYVNVFSTQDNLPSAGGANLWSSERLSNSQCIIRNQVEVILCAANPQTYRFLLLLPHRRLLLLLLLLDRSRIKFFLSFFLPLTQKPIRNLSGILKENRFVATRRIETDSPLLPRNSFVLFSGLFLRRFYLNCGCVEGKTKSLSFN